MKEILKYGLISFLIIFNIPAAIAQNLNGSDNYNLITAEFRKENIQIEPQDAFFNVLKISNRSEKDQFVNLSFETPLGWNLITDNQQRINIKARDSVFVPLRASTNRNVKGEIGYSIVASLTTRAGNPVTTAYSFVKIPRRSDISFRPLSRVSYIDQKKQSGTFSFRLINDGNIDEVVNLQFNSTSNLDVRGEVNNQLTKDLTLPAKSDTIIHQDVVIGQKENRQSLFKVTLNGQTETDEFNSTFWFRYLSNHYAYELPEGEIPLIVSLSLENLFNEYDSYFSGYARGNILFDDNREIDYYLHKYSGNTNDFFRYIRTDVNYSTKLFRIGLGDRIRFYSRHGQGRGVDFEYRLLNGFRLGAKYTRNILNPINNYGATLGGSIGKYNLDLEMEYTNDKYRDQEALLGHLNFYGNISEEHSIKMDVGLSQWTDSTLSHFDNLGHLYRIYYQGKFDGFQVRFRTQRSSDNYYGRSAGRNMMGGDVTYPDFHGYRLRLTYNSYRTKPYMRNLGEELDKYSLSRRTYLQATRVMDEKLSLYGGPVYDFYNSNYLYGPEENRAFITHGASLKVGARFRFSSTQRLNSSIKGGVTFVDNYLDSSNPSEQLIVENRKNNFNAIFDLNYFGQEWGLFFRYYYGPYNGNQYFNYFYSGLFSQSLRLMPYYRAFIYEDLIELDSRLNYMYSINTQTQRINWGNHVRFHLDYGIIMELIGNLTFQSSVDQSSDITQSGEQKYTYNSSYFELRMKKKFNWNQPRNKYYNLKLTLYKDLNGNLKKDYNEPGVKDVLVQIEKLDPSRIDTIDVDYSYSGNLATNRLLSGMKGTINYENIPRGVYKISLQNVGPQTGKFTADQQEVLVHMDGDKNIAIPFLERNKIYGSVILNRSKLSNLGSLDKGNIKVTAVDSKGRETSTLTDQKGEFTLYAPSVDKYDVYINNIFQEHFDLRKNHYTVQLNGYKQFEVNFIFDEKRRQINFTPSMAETDVEVKSVKRTNLTGTVKDENTLQPLRATLEVVDNKTGSTVETTHSNRETGRFSMSFMTGNNYSLIVSSSGYWLHTENLDLDPMLTIQDVQKEILLKNIMIGSRLDIKNLRFAPGSTEIPNDAYPELDRLLEQLKNNPNVRIQIAGHADALEQLEHENISEERAKAVAKYFMQNGFSNIEYVGHKANKPVVPNDTPENRAQNRRVEITVVDK
jgi:outer membrane protein OmpA-like peptidoglycan-associated protein